MKKYWSDRRRQATHEEKGEVKVEQAVGHRYPKKGARPRLINKEGRVVAQ